MQERKREEGKRKMFQKINFRVDNHAKPIALKPFVRQIIVDIRKNLAELIP